MADVTIRFLPPAEPLRQAIAFYYVVRIGSEAVEDLLHPDGAHVRLVLAGDWRMSFANGGSASANGPNAFFTGPLSRAAMVHGGPHAVMVGVALWPPGWALLSDRSAADFIDALYPLADLLGEDAREVLEALLPLDDDSAYAGVLDRWLLSRLAARPPVDPIVAATHLGLEDVEVASVAEWARRLGCSTRRLERLTRDYIGLAPKRLLRRQRFLRSSASLRAEPLGGWSRVIDEGYADQPQFTREFKHFMGMSPRAYFARQTPLTTAAAIARKALAQSADGPV